MKRCLVAIAVAGLCGCSPSPDPAFASSPGVSISVPAHAAGAPAGTVTASQSNWSAVSTASSSLENIVRAEDTLDTLRGRLGAANVRRHSFRGPEGDAIDGWLLFPDDPSHRLAVYPDRSGAHPSMLLVGDGATAWLRGDGLRLGLDSNTVEKLNGRPFDFAGFDWDYGGQVMDWKGGRLAHGGHFVGPVRLCAERHVPDGYPMGDSDFSSHLDVVRRHPARVCEFGISFGTGSQAR